MKHQISKHDISSSAVVMFNFSTMNVKEYNYDMVDEIVLLAMDIAKSNKVKVIMSMLPPRYVEQWGDRQYMEHSDINEYLSYCMMKYEA